jgi:hypothetical protein
MSNNPHPTAAAGSSDPAPLHAFICVPPDVPGPDRLAQSQIEPAPDAGPDDRPDRAQRADGWTPDRIRAFLNALAETGVVADACQAAGMSRQSAYALRNRAAGRPFLLAWRGALLLARRRLADDVLSRAIAGSVETIYRDGKVWGQHHRYDNRLAMAVLTRLDGQAAATDGENATARLVAEEFDEFVDILCAGDEEGVAAAVSDFLGHRCALGDRLLDEDQIFARASHYVRHGIGLDPAIADDEEEEEDEEAGGEGDTGGEVDEVDTCLGVVKFPGPRA